MAGLILEWLLLANLLLIMSSIPKTGATKNTVIESRDPRLSCRPCKDTNCRKIKKKDCPWGFVKDVCNCCNVCAMEPGDTCGGLWNMGGSCGKGLVCSGEDPSGGIQGSGEGSGDVWGRGLCTTKKFCRCGLSWKKLSKTP